MEGVRERNDRDEPRRGFRLFCQQFSALMKKNFLLSWRNRLSMILQLTASFLFVFLVFCAQKAFASRLKFTTFYDNIHDPEYKLVGGILPCEDGFFIKSPCYDFVWSGSSSSVISSIVKNIVANNPGRAIPPSKVKGFATPADVGEWLAANPMRCTGALHFHLGNSNSTVQRLGYGIQTNSTSKRKRGQYEDHTLKFQIPLQVAAEREIARYLLGGVFEDSNQVKLDHQASNSNPLQPLEDLMKIWRFTQVSWMEINHEREICERICRDIT